MASPITVLELNKRLSNAIAVAPDVRNVWVTGETSDLRMSGGHCYFELLQKDDSGRTLARIKANIWASTFPAVAHKFQAETGRPLASGIKILVRVTAGYHPAYGMSVTVSEIDASFTLGDAVRRRNEIIMRLQNEGLIELNRKVRWPAPALRIAVISARGAAGYGDFINTLFHNEHRLDFSVTLFAATMQGERAVPDVLAALMAIGRDADMFDCVVIIRGGGSTSDLEAFDNYDLAAAIARMPLPVIVGIGHERDTTVLDYVANMRVKTPTAAAEWLIARGKAVLESLDRVGRLILDSVTDRIRGDREQLAMISASIPALVSANVAASRARLDRAASLMATVAPAAVSRQMMRLDNLADAVARAVPVRIAAASQCLDALRSLVRVLSPETTLERGFSITLGPDGHVLRDASAVKAGDGITTILADGRVSSTVNAADPK